VTTIRIEDLHMRGLLPTTYIFISSYSFKVVLIYTPVSQLLKADINLSLVFYFTFISNNLFVIRNYTVSN